DSHIRKPLGLDIDFEKHELIATFDGLVKDTAFVHQIKAILKLLQDKLGMPVDIEFVSDGTDFYLLQCRPQSYSRETIPAPIPRDLPQEKIIFTANRYISNGYLPDITHIVYVDPMNYTHLKNKSEYNAVGRAVSKLNKLLPKRQFILMGPGRWGSRGDIKLGVNVTYSDINNTAALIEIARKKGNYVPDLSFGTHFFQDLVESSIRYLPLYPDDDGIIFNESFMQNSRNILPDMLPEYDSIEDTVRVIDIPENTGGQTLRILMNANLGEALGILSAPETRTEQARISQDLNEPHSESHWRWRLLMAEQLASKLDGDYFGIKGCYLFGSTKNATAGPASDIDLLIHFQGTVTQKKELCQWLDGWSRCLDEMNYLRTGYKSGGLLDLHFITDEDIKKKTSYAVKINAVTDAARPLAMKNNSIE
ncbi:pyruvate, phosphate dikinase, partial [candidate division KSB1 bacterium]|nr:pyruvate, phosphate dikinase [candidate division KSB1 bacterium]